jgi:hypothetical protein
MFMVIVVFPEPDALLIVSHEVLDAAVHEVLVIICNDELLALGEVIF